MKNVVTLQVIWNKNVVQEQTNATRNNWQSSEWRGAFLVEVIFFCNWASSRENSYFQRTRRTVKFRRVCTGAEDARNVNWTFHIEFNRLTDAGKRRNNLFAKARNTDIADLTFIVATWEGSDSCKEFRDLSRNVPWASVINYRIRCYVYIKEHLSRV